MGLTCYNNYVKINSKTFENSNPELVLKTVFGYDEFRPFQKEIINSVLHKKDTLAIMPTGGGKSICYQIPALILEGISIVISPLISLMQDQVASLNASGVHAVFLNSLLEWDEYLKAIEKIKNGEVKILYISPEGLASSRIRDLLTDEKIKVSLITVDEAHCISQWGHDFRPDYLEICTVRRLLGNVPVIALTATATQQVREDIIKNLKLKAPNTFVSSFDRPNIFIEVQQKRNPLDQVIKFIKKHAGESGIIYCYSRRQVDELTETLDKLGYSVKNYHAGLSDSVRAKNQDLFVKDEVQIMIATIAFGMGIDKPNVRYVINYDLPKSIEEYYQEIGRAGRDGLPSYALLLFTYGDVHKIKYFINESATPEKAELLLQKMVHFATSKICRRKELLLYFGENYQNTNEKDFCCDICSKGDIPLSKVTIPFQKLLSCIIRTNERFGASYIIDVLLGSRQKRIIENGHNFISTWGIGRELCKNDWLELIDLLIFEKYLFKDGDFSILRINKKGLDALSNRDDIYLPIEFSTSQNKAANFDPDGKREKTEFIIHKKNNGEKIIAEKPDQDDKKAENIIAELKNWRKRKADDLNVPPYVIFGDKTMLDLAAKKPKNKAELLRIYGIGQAKAEQFGSTILRIISDNC